MERHWRKRRHIDTEVERLHGTTVNLESGREDSSNNELNSNITRSVSEKNFQSSKTPGRVTKPFTEVEFDDEDGSGIDEEASQRQQRVEHRRFSKRMNRRQRRESINEPGTLERVNSGISKGILGEFRIRLLSNTAYVLNKAPGSHNFSAFYKGGMMRGKEIILRENRFTTSWQTEAEPYKEHI